MFTHRLQLAIVAAVVLLAILLAMLALVDAPAAARASDPSEPAAPEAPTEVPPARPSATAPTPRTTSLPAPVERVLVVGDSITQSAQEPITAALEQHGAEVRVLAWGGTAPCDWIEAVAAEVTTFEPEVVLIEFAGNDLTPCIADTPRNHPDFIDRYTTDAAALTEAAGAAGATVRWTSVPYIAHADHEAIARQLNELYRSLSDDGVLTPLRAALTVDGGFGLADRCRAAAECGDAAAFSAVPIRSDDGLHLADAGSVRMASVYGQVVHRLAV
ncbi:MAG: hypothetical protein OES57_10395 [Acidimicrobiia bacterium]|nr:hypothetical protein [Acidimicrobiia bacterium]